MLELSKRRCAAAPCAAFVLLTTVVVSAQQPQRVQQMLRILAEENRKLRQDLRRSRSVLGTPVQVRVAEAGFGLTTRPATHHQSRGGRRSPRAQLWPREPGMGGNLRDSARSRTDRKCGRHQLTIILHHSLIVKHIRIREADSEL